MKPSSGLGIACVPFSNSLALMPILSKGLAWALTTPDLAAEKRADEDV